jgi:hypothetical protein
MPAYRIYWFDQNGHVTETDYLIAEADDDVRDWAAAHLGIASAVEVLAPGAPRRASVGRQASDLGARHTRGPAGFTWPRPRLWFR